MINRGDDAFVAAMMKAHPEIPYKRRMNENQLTALMSVQEPKKPVITCKEESFDVVSASDREPVEVIHRDVLNVSSDIETRLESARRFCPHISISDTIIKVVCYASGFDERELKSPRRHKQLVRWRQICMYVMYQHTGMSTPAIGKKIGGRDHSTVLHALRKIKDDYESFKTEIELVESFL